MIPRFLHHLYASALGYFWLPCPRCGVHFGGHEVIKPNFVHRHIGHPGPWEGKALCPVCTRLQEAEDRAAYAALMAWRRERKAAS